MTQNGGKADIKGAELELAVQPTQALSFDAAASYLDFKYKSISPLALASGVTLDMTTPYTAKWNLTDKYYYTNGADLRSALSFTCAVPGAPPMWALTVKKDFGK